MTDSHYIGRFAPSPSGELHFGSLIAALGSYLQARAQNGIWRVRIEDIDPPREVPGAAETILRQLEHFGLHWDGEVLWQSKRHEAYRERLAWLREQGLCYYCTCTRARIHAIGGLYDGHCRDLRLGAENAALRLRQTRPVLEFYDQLRGTMSPTNLWRVKILLSIAAMGCSPIIWRWWWTIIFRASAKSSAVPILSSRRCGKFRSISILAGRRRTISICRWPSMRRAINCRSKTTLRRYLQAIRARKLCGR